MTSASYTTFRIHQCLGRLSSYSETTISSNSGVVDVILFIAILEQRLNNNRASQLKG